MTSLEFRSRARPAVGRLAGLRGPGLVAAGAAGLTALAALHSPYQAGAYLGCPLYLLTGLYCPVCGSTRALHDLAHLDLAAAWHMNPLFVLLVPVLVLTWLRWVARAWRHGPGGPARIRPISSRRAVVVMVVLLVYGVARNIPVLAPWLAP